MLIGNPSLKEVSLENKEVSEKTTLHLQVNEVDSSKVEVAFHVSNELASLVMNEKERLVVEISEGFEQVSIDTNKIDNGIKRGICNTV